jgi:hypothetical protein
VLANEFADLVGVQLGTNVSTAEFGPFFATSINNGAVWNFPVGFATTYGGTEGLLDVFTWAVATQVPEPGTLALLGIGLLGMAVVRRRKLI